MRHRLGKKSCLGILLFGLGWTVTVKAISIPYLYQVQVPVKTSENVERTDALRRAFQEVLWRITGNAKALETPAVQHALTEVEQYLQQYRYIPATDSLLLQVDWNSVKLKTLIQNAQLSFWENDRPLVLVWFVKENLDKTQQLLGESEKNTFWLPFLSLAERRGIPIVLPTLDLLDQDALSTSVIWTSDLPKIKAASKRYGANKILVGKLIPHVQSVKIDWLLLAGEQSETWSESGLLESDVLEKSVNTLVTHLSSGLTMNPVIPSSLAPSQEFLITVTDLQSIVDLETAKAVIKQIPSVSSVIPSLINQTEVSFKVVGQGDKKTIKEDLRLKEHLMEVDSDGTMEQELVYRWVP